MNHLLDQPPIYSINFEIRIPPNTQLTSQISGGNAAGKPVESMLEGEPPKK